MTNFLLVKDSRIEKINSCKSIKYSYTVAPHVGVWIETLITLCRTQERPVAPHVGAWIETSKKSPNRSISSVAPHVGA